MRFALSIFYKNIIFDDLKNIPLDKPSIFACTHPNSFLDAIIIGAYSPRKLYFLARSDVFNTPLKMWLLSRMNLIPIYRLQEGSENLHKNELTFSKCYDIMKKGGSILIFSEGISVTDKLVRPLKKGTARIAFGAEAFNAFQLGLQIIPMSLNYTHPTQFRSEVIIGIKKPIAIKKYQSLYEESQTKAIRQFNAELYEGIKSATIIVNNNSTEGVLYEKVAPILRSQLNNPISHRLKLEQQWSDRTKQVTFIQNLPNYPSSHTVQTEQIINGQLVSSLSAFGIAFLNAILWFIGYIPNAIPFLIAKTVTAKTVKLIEFYASVRLCLSVVLYLVYWPFFSYIIGSLLDLSFIFVGAIFILTGMLYVRNRDQYRAIKMAKKFFSRKNAEELIRFREEVITEFN
jgi:1-acyl-sn-glycerol-3-phosphate acyltransferase